MIYYFEDARVLILLLSIFGFGLAKAFSDRMIWYPKRYVNNKFWKHAEVKDQCCKPISNILAFLKDGYHLLVFIMGVMAFLAGGIWDIWLGLFTAFILWIVQKVFMR